MDNEPVFVTHRASGPIYDDTEFRKVAAALVAERDRFRAALADIEEATGTLDEKLDAYGIVGYCRDRAQSALNKGAVT